jgi:hypothetical protein
MDNQLVKQTAELLQGIIRSVDKKLEYSVVDQKEEGRFSLQLSLRGREGIVSLVTDDLLVAAHDSVRKNAIRQKIKSTRDGLLSHNVVDVMGTKAARMLKQADNTKDDFRPSGFRRQKGRR